MANGNPERRREPDQRRDDRRQRERREQRRHDEARDELRTLREEMLHNAARIQLLEREQHVQLVRIAQIQAELNGLKKSSA